jgi:hypothetical protein
VADNLKRPVLDVSGHPSQYGAPAPYENILVAHITLCQHWLAYVAEERIHCRPALVGARGHSVVFADGRGLAWHVATTPLYCVREVFKLPTQSGWDLDSAKPPTTTAGLVQAIDDIY